MPDDEEVQIVQKRKRDQTQPVFFNGYARGTFVDGLNVDFGVAGRWIWYEKQDVETSGNKEPRMSCGYALEGEPRKMKEAGDKTGGKSLSEDEDYDMMA